MSARILRIEKTVRETYAERCKRMGIGNLIPMMQIGSQPAEETEKSIRLFASEVMPYLRAELGDTGMRMQAAE